MIFPIYCNVYVDTEKFGTGHKNYLFMQVSKSQEGFGFIYCCKLHKMSFQNLWKEDFIAPFVKMI